MKSHLRKELLLNDTPYGLQVMTANTEDVTQKTRRKRDITEEQRRGMDFNQYFENLQQNSYYFIPKNEEYLNYENEEYKRTLNADNNAYGQVWNVYPNTRPVDVHPANQYGYAVDQNQGSQAIAEWGKYYQDLNEGNVPGIYQYLSNRTPEKEYVGLRLEDRGSATANLQKELEEERNDNVRLTSMTKEFDSSSTGIVIKTASKQNVMAKGMPISKPSNSSNCSLLRKHSIYKSIWMGASPDWTILQIHLGMGPYKALEQAKKSLLHYRDYLNDLWNIHGLTAGSGYGLDGQPWCTSHYTFHMVLWHIPFALSGQQYSIIERSLSFNPRVQVPYALPFFVPYASGTIAAIHSPYRRTVVYKVSVTHGYLVLKSLVISGTVWPGKVLKLEKGESVMWS